MTALVLALLVAAAPDEGPTCLTPAWFAAAPCVGADAVGGVLLGMGALFTSMDATGGGDNCVEECALAVFTAALVTFGIILGVGGAVALGPLAALVVVVVAATSTLVAGRTPIPSLIGGTPGVLLGVAGVIVAGVGLAHVTNVAGASDFLDVSRGPQQVMWAGVATAALAGPVALIGVVAADALFGAPLFPDEQ